MAGDLTAGQVNLTRGVKLPNFADAANYPSSPDIGLLIFDSTELKMKVWTGDPEDQTNPGGGWVAVGDSVVLGGNKSLGFNWGGISTYSAPGGSASISSASGPLGGEYYSVSYTPTSATSKLFISVNIPWMGETSNHSDHFTFGLYKDSNATALALWYADDRYQDNADSDYLGSGNHQCWLKLNYVEDAGSTAPRTYRVRGGCNGGACGINGSGNSYQGFPGQGTAFNIQSNIVIFEFEGAA